MAWQEYLDAEQARFVQELLGICADSIGVGQAREYPGCGAGGGMGGGAVDGGGG